jgi:autotransporter-associated beta strand protein
VHLVNIKAYFSSFASFGGDTVVISAPTAATNGTIKIFGSRSAPKTVVIEDKDALPINGRVEVFEYAQLDLNVPNLTGSYVLGGIDHGSDIYVHENARLLISKPCQLNANSSSVFIDGGIVAFTPASDNTDSSVYFYELTLKDGARIVGRDPRVRRRGGGAKLNVRGEKPSYCDSGIVLWAESPDDPGALKIDVEDVTKDDAADFTINGSLRLTSNESYRNCTVYKTGAGTLRLNGHSDYMNPTRIQGGTLLLGVNDAMHSGMSIACEGGSLAVDGGTTNTLGSLRLASSAVVRIDADAKLSFADSSAESWDEKVLLTVEADLNEQSVRFGENSAGLTGFQLRRIRCGGKRCYLDENGYLRQRNDGLHIHLK